MCVGRLLIADSGRAGLTSKMGMGDDGHLALMAGLWGLKN